MRVYNNVEVEIIKLCIIFTKTPLANFHVKLFNFLRVSIPGRVSHRSFQLFQASRYRQFLHIALCVMMTKTGGRCSGEPQTPRLPIKHSLNFSQCSQIPLGYRRQYTKRETRINIHRPILLKHVEIIKF